VKTYRQSQLELNPDVDEEEKYLYMGEELVDGCGMWDVGFIRLAPCNIEKEWYAM